MSDELRAWMEEIRARRESAFAMVSSLCQPRGTQGSREWIMSIPARPDHDPDLVIGAALKDIDALLAHIDAQADEIERLRREREVLGEAARLLGPLAEHAAQLEANRSPQDVYEFGNSYLVSDAKDAYIAALALLDGEKGGDDDA